MPHVRDKRKRALYYSVTILLLMLLPWMFFATIPDALNPRSEYMTPKPGALPYYDPIPVDAPIQLQYDAFPLELANVWVHNVHGDSLIDMGMLETINEVCKSKNVSLELMLGIINAEHSLLSASIMLRSGGWTQYNDAQINPFSYGWTDETTVPMIGVQQSAQGAAGIMTSAVKSWMDLGWDPQNYSQFISYLSQWYVNGPNNIDLNRSYNSWASIVLNTMSAMQTTGAQGTNAEMWAVNIKKELKSGVHVFGQDGLGQLNDTTIAAIPSFIAETQSAVNTAVQRNGDNPLTSISPNMGKIVKYVGIGVAVFAGIALALTGIGALIEMAGGAAAFAPIVGLLATI